MTLTKIWQYLPFFAVQGEQSLSSSCTLNRASERHRDALPGKSPNAEWVGASTLTSHLSYVTLSNTGTSLTKAFVNHHLYGPPKPSWGVELTLFTAFLREVAAYSHLSSLTRLRYVGVVTLDNFISSRGMTWRTLHPCTY